MTSESSQPAGASTAPKPEVLPAGTKTPTRKPGLVTWVILSGKLEVSPQALNAWRARPDAPTEPHVPTWRRYVKKHHLGDRTKGVADDLRTKKVEAEIEFMKARTARARRETMAISEVNELLLEVSTQSRAELYHWMESALPPKLEGLSAAQIRGVLREAADAICDRMADLLKRFEEDR